MKLTVKDCAVPLAIGGLVVGMVVPSRDEADQPDTHVAENVSFNFYGNPAIPMIATSSSSFGSGPSFSLYPR